MAQDINWRNRQEADHWRRTFEDCARWAVKCRSKGDRKNARFWASKARYSLGLYRKFAEQVKAVERAA